MPFQPNFVRNGERTAYIDMGTEVAPVSFEYQGTGLKVSDLGDRKEILEVENAQWPGTDFKFHLRFEVSETGPNWTLQITLRLPKFSYRESVSVDLLKWVKGELAEFSLPPGFAVEIGKSGGLGLAQVAPSAGKLLFGCLRKEHRADVFALKGEFQLTGSIGPLRITRASLLFDLVTDTGDYHGGNGGPHNWSTAFNASAAGVVREPAVHAHPSASRPYRVEMVPETVTAIGFEDTDSRRGALLRGGGAGTIESGPLRLRASRLEIVDRRPIGAKNSVQVSGSPSEERIHLVVGDCLAEIGGNADPAKPGRFDLLFSGNASPELQFDTLLHSVELPVEGADLASLKFHRSPRPLRVNLAKAGLPAPAPLPPGADDDPRAFPPLPARLDILPAGPGLAVDLHHARLHVRRHQDLLNVKFELFGSELRIGKKTELAPLALPAGVRPKLVVHFGSQHVSEHAYPVQAGKDPGIADAVTEGRAAGESRLAFALAAPASGKLALATLLGWSKLEPLTSKRAAVSRDTPQLLQQFGIDPATARSDALAKLKSDLAAPNAWETAIEIPYRVILSPDPGAAWSASSAPAGSTSAQPLWHVRLHRMRSMRVVWARGVDTAYLGTDASAADQASWPGKDRPEAPDRFPISVNAADRRQLMLLSSVWGLPGRRRAGAPAQSAPRGSVLSLPGKWQFLHDEEGVYVPLPLESAELVLTPLGGSLVAEGRWEPPAQQHVFKGKNSWGPALTVERWSHKTHLGRDTSVEVVHKGFLFPLGHRASYVKRTERRFYAHPENGEPVAYLVQRHFLEIGQRDKAFPALGQPFEGRLLPDVRSLTLKTRRSADLQDARAGTFANVRNFKLDNNGALELPGAPTDPGSRPLAFWPRTGTRTGSEFLFELVANDGGIIRTPLMFLDNAVVHDPALMRHVTEHYLGSGAWAPLAAELEALRTARHDGAAHRYAPPPAASRAQGASSGDTSYQTRSWLWSVTGRQGAGPAAAAPIPRMTSILPPGAVCEDFAMDALMEGADQPPFYPAIERADLRVQTIERLVGKPLDAITVAPNLIFVERGIDPSVNPGEVFLDILEPELKLDFSQAGGTSGGLAQPNARIVHLSRTIGPVGGASVARRAIRSGRPAGTAEGPQTGFLEGPAPASGLAKSPGEAGSFDPFDFFGDAKLLGAVPLKQVVKAAALAAAPRLVEQVQMGAAGAQDAIEATRQAVREADRHLDEMLRQLVLALEEAAAPIGIAWQTAYPQIDAAVRHYQARMEAALAAAADRPAELLTTVAPAAEALRSLLATLREFAAQPLPLVLVDTINRVTRQVEAIRSLVEAKPEAIKAEVERLFLSALASRFPADLFSANPALAKILFGTDKPSLEALRSGDFIANARDTLFYEQVGRPLAEQLAGIRTAMTALEVNRDGLSAMLAALIEKGLGFAGAFGSFAGIARATQQQCAVVGALAARFCQAAFSPAAQVLAHVRAVRDQLVLIAADSPNADLANQLTQLRSDALRALDALAGSLAGIGELTARMDPAWQRQCDVAGLAMVGEVVRLRAEATAQARDVAEAFGGFIQLLGKWQETPDAAAIVAAKNALAAANAPLHAILREVTSIKAAAAGLQPLLKAEIDRLAPLWSTIKNDAKATQKDLVDAALAEGKMEAERLRLKLDASEKELLETIQRSLAYPNRTVARLSDEIAAYAAQQDRRLAGLLTAGGRLAKAEYEALEGWAFGVLRQISANVLPLYATVGDALRAVLQLLTDEPAGPIAQLLVGPAALARLRGLEQSLQAERTRLADIVQLCEAGNAQAFARANDLVAAFKAAPANLAAAPRQLLDLAKSLVSGQLGAVLPIAQIERSIAEQLQRFVPTKIELRYDWQTDLGSFPSSNPIFQMAPSARRPHLSLNTLVAIDLLAGGKRTFKGVGKLEPFQINLLGKFRLLTIDFSEAIFNLGASGVRMDVNVQKVTIGPHLQFVQMLQQYMGGGGATGPYWKFDPPVLEVGYRYAQDVIQLGSLFFLNVSFAISAELPLTGRDARFRFQIGSPERPLLISNPPYGGGGFVALVANAKGIVGFEASFEFGAVTPIRFGPLRGHGRVAAGIYISQSRETGAIIAGFVRAIGEGNIACFGISIHIEVRLTHNMNTGQMIGTADYKVSFKVGIAKISYRFTASYRFQGSKGKQSEGPAMLGSDRFSRLWLVDAQTTPAPVIVHAPLKTARWKDYQARYDMDLLEELGLV